MVASEEKDKRVLTSGHRRVTTISAMPGGKAEQVLLAIARPPKYNPDNERRFGEWQDGICCGDVYCANDNSKVPVMLKLGCCEGLFLEDGVGGDSFSLKPSHPDGQKHFSLPIGRRIGDERVIMAANAIIGTWIVHGFQWIDRRGEEIYWPYGEGRQSDSYRLTHSFSIVDGTKEVISLAEFIKRGGVRSAHVGEWLAPYTVVPAACGMKLLLHEFNENGRADDFNVCSFSSLNLSTAPPGVWGPACPWNLSARRTLGNNRKFSDLAEVAGSPFAFHVHATRQIFGNGRLFSGFALEMMGVQGMLNLLKRVETDDPQRFYKLVDSCGVSRRLIEVDSRNLYFDGGCIIERAAVVDNVANSMITLAEIEKNPAKSEVSLPVVVIDSHFYIVVLLGILTSVEGHSYHLGGSEMYRYLTVGDHAKMHAVRNERLYRLCRQMKLAKGDLRFHIYPSRAVALPDVTQYSFEPERFDCDRWLTTVLQ